LSSSGLVLKTRYRYILGRKIVISIIYLLNHFKNKVLLRAMVEIRLNIFHTNITRIFYIQYLQLQGRHYTTPPSFGAADPELHNPEDDQEDGLGMAGHQGRPDYPDEASAYRW
jgi:hypothetical protein